MILVVLLVTVQELEREIIVHNLPNASVNFVPDIDVIGHFRNVFEIRRGLFQDVRRVAMMIGLPRQAVSNEPVVRLGSVKSVENLRSRNSGLTAGASASELGLVDINAFGDVFGVHLNAESDGADSKKVVVFVRLGGENSPLFAVGSADGDAMERVLGAFRKIPAADNLEGPGEIN